MGPGRQNSQAISMVNQSYLPDGKLNGKLMVHNKKEKHQKT